MNDSAVKELKKYIFFGSIGQFIKEIGKPIISIILIVLLAPYILEVFEIEGDTTDKIIWGVIILVMVFNIIGYYFIVSGPKRIIRKFEEKGELGKVLIDFNKGEKLFGDTVSIGNEYIIGKGTNCIVAYDDIEQIYQYIHKTNNYEDFRTLRVCTSSGTEDVCQLPKNGVEEQTVLKLIAYICYKNPDIKVGYK